MSIRNAVVGFSVVFGLALYAWCRPCSNQAQAQGQGPEAIHAADEPGIGGGGNYDEAAARYRGNQSRHWRQVAIGGRGN